MRPLLGQTAGARGAAAARPRPLRHGGGTAGDRRSAEARSARSPGGLEEAETPAPPAPGARAPHAELGSREIGFVLLRKDEWLAWKHNSPRPLDPGSVPFWHLGIRGDHAVMSAQGGTGKRDAAEPPPPGLGSLSAQLCLGLVTAFLPLLVRDGT